MSKYILLGYGVVVRDTNPEDKFAEIAIYETVSMNSTFDNKEKKEVHKEQVNNVGDGFSIFPTNIVEPSMTVNAMWLNAGSTRVNMPMMCQGELVKVYNYEGTDRYHFKLHHLEKDLRRKEILVHAVSNLDKDKDFGKHFDESTSYHWSIDTINKISRFKTAVNDGEPVLWEFKLDSKKGVFTIFVNNKEKVILDGVNDKLTLNIKDSILNGTTMYFNLSKTFTLVASKFLNKAKEYLRYGVGTIKASTNFKSICKFNGLSRTKIKKEPLD